MDAAANVAGVVRSKMDDSKTQAVNFAVKANVLEEFLYSNNIAFESANSTQRLELPDIAEKAEKFTVLVGCWE